MRKKSFLAYQLTILSADQLQVIGEEKMENIIVLPIVGLAVLYLIRIFYKTAKKEDGCGCGCSSCETSVDCTDDPKSPF